MNSGISFEALFFSLNIINERMYMRGEYATVVLSFFLQFCASNSKWELITGRNREVVGFTAHIAWSEKSFEALVLICRFTVSYLVWIELRKSQFKCLLLLLLKSWLCIAHVHRKGTVACCFVTIFCRPPKPPINPCFYFHWNIKLTH